MDPEILARYADRPLPRYTSYPTAPHFTDGFGEREYRAWLGALPDGAPVSVYLHVPFCRSMCWYCGCHTTITARDAPIARYLDALHGEIELVAGAAGRRLAASHIHFGGGTPTLVQPDQFRALMNALGAQFDLAADAEVAVEIDPRTLVGEMIDALADGGVTRASLGVQSFDPDVQRAINRIQTFDQTAAAVRGLRKAGIAGINFDLIYGLPLQTVDSCLATVEQAVSLDPDRIAVFGYAHVPAFKQHQRKIDEAALPGSRERHAQAEAIADALVDAGYVRIGLDHFARPDDTLAEAFARGELRRNFQGYTTDACDTLIGLGASSIGRLPQGHVQNVVVIGDYQRRIADGRLAVAKGCTFTAGDRLRAAIIERIMCDLRVDVGDLCARHGADAASVIGSARGLDALLTDGIAERKANVISVNDSARPLVRALAASFDEYLGQGSVRHSRAI